MTKIVPVLLAGGGGTRLRPLSTNTKPKQFLKLIHDSKSSLLQATAQRALMVAAPEDVITIASIDCHDVIRQQLSVIDSKLCTNILLEPSSRNTCAAISAASIHAANRYDNPIIWTMPTDHLISEPEILKNSVEKSLNNVRKGEIVLFGIKASTKDPNYGYIITNNIHNDGFHNVIRFMEKPEKFMLKQIEKEYSYWWNSGMFIFSSRRFFNEIKKHNYQIFSSSSIAYSRRKVTNIGIELDNISYRQIDPLPIDKVIMENSNNLKMLPVDMGWSDVGTWHSLWEISQKEGASTPLNNFLDKIAKAA